MANDRRIRFTRDSEELACSKPVLGFKGCYVCLRTDGHEGICIPMARTAGAADHRCFNCREPSVNAHKADCDAPHIDNTSEYYDYSWPITYAEERLHGLRDDQLAAINHPLGEMLKLLAPLARKDEAAIDILKRLITAFNYTPLFE